ncbi:hypothetical protein MGH68_00205 [Erysipelothrix sp. D19-032]
MTDQIVRGLARGGRVRFFVTKTTNAVEKARVIHDTYPRRSAKIRSGYECCRNYGINLKK